jgi:hypothetical protein
MGEKAKKGKKGEIARLEKVHATKEHSENIPRNRLSWIPVYSV